MYHLIIIYKQLKLINKVIQEQPNYQNELTQANCIARVQQTNEVFSAGLENKK